MKKIRLIYNPGSGDKSFKNRLDYIIEIFQQAEYQLVPYKTLGAADIEKGVLKTLDDDYYALAVAGGDGTLNMVVNAMMKYGMRLPLGIFPWGTSNDLAAYFKIPRDINRCCANILNGNARPIDLGLINGKYFINVAAGGLLTDVPQKVDINLKNTLGKLAYYLKGIEQIPNFRPIEVRISANGRSSTERIYLFMVFNGCSAGGFDLLAKDALIDDGKLDFLAVKACPLRELVGLFIKILRGDHLDDGNIVYFRADRLSIDCGAGIETDIDGEYGPGFPVDISAVPNAVRILVP